MLRIYRFSSPHKALSALTGQLLLYLSPFALSRNRRIAPTVELPRLALSGGETGKLLLNLWRTSYPDHPLWHKMHFYWIDERCVSPTNCRSNFGTAARMFLNPLGIVAARIHPIHGENPPHEEALRYSRLLQSQCLPSQNLDAPAQSPFHCAIVGIGSDGHTASVFSLDSLTEQSVGYYATRHPLTGEPRITASMQLLLNIPCIFIALIDREKEVLLRNRLRRAAPPTPGEYLLRHHRNIHIFTTLPQFP